jgi:hypothetical protein
LSEMVSSTRLAAFQAAGEKDIPVVVESLDNPKIAEEFYDKFRPIEDGRKIVVVPKSGRPDARRVLREHDKYDN